MPHRSAVLATCSHKTLSFFQERCSAPLRAGAPKDPACTRELSMSPRPIFDRPALNASDVLRALDGIPPGNDRQVLNATDSVRSFFSTLRTLSNVAQYSLLPHKWA